LQLTKLSDDHDDDKQQDSPIDNFNEIMSDPKLFPLTVSNAAPVEGTLYLANAVILKDCSSNPTRIETFLTMEATEITKSGLLRMDGKTLIATRESHIHVVESVEDLLKVALANNRVRKLESFAPNDDPQTVIVEDDDMGVIDTTKLTISSCAKKEMPVLATALL
jgi:hypothetical protein